MCKVEFFVEPSYYVSIVDNIDKFFANTHKLDVFEWKCFCSKHIMQ